MKLCSLFSTPFTVAMLSASLARTSVVSAAHGNATLCSKYTMAVFGEDTGENQLALMEAVVDLAVLGDMEMGVPGILAPEGSLVSFFSGEAETTNRGGTATQVNFLDGAADLPHPSPTSNTSILFSHLYQFFGALLGCNAEGFPMYMGNPDMYQVHKFMDLDKMQMDYFNNQVALAAGALGVSEEDIATVGGVLDGVFNMRCTPLLMADSGVPAFLVGTNPSICQAESCPVADEDSCPDMMDMAPEETMDMDMDMEGSMDSMEDMGMTQDDSICVKYTKALFGDNMAENQLALMEAVVDLAVLGDMDLGVAGILASEGGLVPFFSGAADTTNRGGDPTKVNFLDGAGDFPDSSSTSNTSILFSHLYQFFGALLGCTAEGFPMYMGNPDMYSVHKFMNLDIKQLDYFNSQVTLAAYALGVKLPDVVFIRKVLDDVFSMQCTPLVTEDSGLPSFMVGTDPSICQAVTCPVMEEEECDGTAVTIEKKQAYIEEEEAGSSAADGKGSSFIAVIGILSLAVMF